MKLIRKLEDKFPSRVSGCMQPSKGYGSSPLVLFCNCFSFYGNLVNPCWFSNEGDPGSKEPLQSHIISLLKVRTAVIQDSSLQSLCIISTTILSKQHSQLKAVHKKNIQNLFIELSTTELDSHVCSGTLTSFKGNLLPMIASTTVHKNNLFRNSVQCRINFSVYMNIKHVLLKDYALNGFK